MKTTLEIPEQNMLIALSAYTPTVDFFEIAQQLYAQMMEWA